MNNKRKRQSARSIALGTASTAAGMLAKSMYVEGGLLLALSMVLMAYAEQFHSELPEGIDQETFEQLADLGADGIKALRDQTNSND